MVQSSEQVTGEPEFIVDTIPPRLTGVRRLFCESTPLPPM